MGGQTEGLDLRLVFSAVAVIFILSRIIKVYNDWKPPFKFLGRIPGPSYPFGSFSFPGAVFPTSWWNKGLYWVWSERLTCASPSSRKRYWEITLEQSIRGSAPESCLLFLSSPARPRLSRRPYVARQIKPESGSAAVLRVTPLWGVNLIASEKDTWRRHRRIMGPAFNPKAYALVWAETIRIYHDMVATEGWESKFVVDIKAVQDYTFRLALFVISACGFGVTFHWDEPPVGNDGTMSLQKALRIFTESSMLQIFAPKWVLKLPFQRFPPPLTWPPRLREIMASKKVLAEYMAKQISERKAELAGTNGLDSRKDVFSLLVKASEEDGKLKMDDTELVGNVFGILFAGHKTTAHTLAATLGFLGITPEIQREVCDQIVDVVGLERDPAFDDFVNLDKVSNVFFEALRLFRTLFYSNRQVAADASGTRIVPVQKGYSVVVDMTGVQYNPRYFSEPYKFNPGRWCGVATEAEGPRTCIGRKFAAAEAVCFLTLFLRDWYVEPVLNPGETGEQWRERIKQAELSMTLGVKPVPVRLTRRMRSS
ncbi:cytochrome P450 [Gloeopeniophorella convolvens]|nr:cytochrome P450 [Gloeopeniophorella convolvens]